MQPAITHPSPAATGDASRLQRPVDERHVSCRSGATRHVAPRHGGRVTRRLVHIAAPFVISGGGAACAWLIVTIVLAATGVVPWVH